MWIIADMHKGNISRRLIRIAAAAGLVCSMGSASATAAPALESPYIFGGRASDDCEWPNVGRLGGCTATLMSENMIVFAAHCGADHRYVSFDGGKQRVKIKHCEVNPAFGESTLGQGIDWGYCILADTSWTKHVPIVPPMREGELKDFSAPYPATLVGYGRTDFGLGSGKLAEVDTWVTGMGTEASIGGEGADSCQGDSGGPAFIQLADGSWRAFGITSYGGACGKGGYYSFFADAVKWAESRSGMRLPNCDEGKSYACETLMLDPGGNYGREDGHCKAGPLLEPGAAPELRWVSPVSSQLVNDHDSVQARLRIKHVDRVENARLVIELDGKEHELHEKPAKELVVNVGSLAPGQHVLRAKLLDEEDEVRGVARLAFRWDVRKSAPVDSNQPQVWPAKSKNQVKEDPRVQSCSLVGASGVSGWGFGLLVLLRAFRRRKSSLPC